MHFKLNNFKFTTVQFLLTMIFLSACNNAADSPYPVVRFTERNAMPGNGRSSAVAFAIDGFGYVALGRDADKKKLNDCWKYNPTLDNWTKQADFPGIPRVNALAGVVNGKAYVGLGFSQGVYNESSYLKDFWMYDPAQNSWSEKAVFPGSETNASECFVLNDVLYICSGFMSNGFNNTLWKYEPENDKWTQLNDGGFPERAGGVTCQNDKHIYFGTGYRTLMENDWWEYIPENDKWIKRKSLPDKGRVNGLGISVGNRCFVATGRFFAGELTGGHLKSDIVEYDTDKNVWYERGNLPASGRENAISFTIDGKAYIGFGENDTNVLNDFWSFEP